MRFMFMVKTPQPEEGISPPPALIEAIGKLTEEMIRAGKFIGNGGLLPSRFGARIRSCGGRLSVTDGPFVETKEVIGGFGIFNADSKEDAIEMGQQFMQIHLDVLGPSYEAECEIRQMLDGDNCAEAHEASRTADATCVTEITSR